MFLGLAAEPDADRSKSRALLSWRRTRRQRRLHGPLESGRPLSNLVSFAALRESPFLVSKWGLVFVVPARVPVEEKNLLNGLSHDQSLGFRPTIKYVTPFWNPPVSC